MIIFILQERLEQEKRAACLGEGAGQGDKERFTKAKMNVEAQAFGHHNLAKGGICKNATKSLTKINQGLGEKNVGCVVYCFITSLQSLETHQCHYPSLSPGPGVFESHGWHYLGSN